MWYVVLFGIAGTVAGLALATAEWSRHGATVGLAGVAGALTGGLGIVLARWAWRRIRSEPH
jgi:hypothetical protein